MKRIAVYCLLLPLSLIANAQQFSTSITGEFEFQPVNAIIKAGNNYIDFGEIITGSARYGITSKIAKYKFGLWLSMHDSSLQLIKENILPDKDCGPFYPLVKKIGNKLFLIYYHYDDQDNTQRTIKVMASEIDTTTSLNVLPPVELLTIDQENVGFGMGNEILSHNRLIVQSSSDNKKIVVCWASNKNNSFFFSVLDENLKLIYAGKKAIANSDEVRVSSACVDNSANVYISYRTKESKKDFPSYIMICEQQSPDKNFVIETSAGHYVSEVILLPSKNNDLIDVMGIYNTMGYLEDNTTLADGAFFSAINSSSLKLDKVVETPLPENLAAQFKSEDWAKISRKNYGNFYILFKPYELENGNIDLVGENRGDNVNPPAANGIWTMSGSIININFGHDGNAIFSRIPKLRASAESTIGDSYFALPYKDQMIILYNDYASELEKDISANPSQADKYNKFILIAGVINPDGSVQRKELVDLTDDEFLAMTEHVVKSQSTLLIPFQKIGGLGGIKKEFKWAVISIK